MVYGLKRTVLTRDPTGTFPLKPTAPLKSPAYNAAHKFTRTAEAVALLADRLIAEFALLQTAAIDLQAAAPSRGDMDEMYATNSALKGLLFEEFQRLGAPWTNAPALAKGRLSLIPMAKKAADIADAVLARKAA